MERSVAAGLPGWVGRRVVVRHLLADGRASDALGTLLAVADGHLVVRRDRVPADGTPAEVRVALADVLLAKPVPPPPPRRRGRGQSSSGSGPQTISSPAE